MAILALILPMIASRFGYTTLNACAVFLLMTTLIFAGFIVEIFGYATSAAVTLFAAIFLVTDIIGEMYGHKKAFKTVIITIIANTLFVIFGLLLTTLIPIEQSSLTEAIKVFFTFVPRVLIGSIVAYAISQTIDVYIFKIYKTYTKGKKLWLRNIGSTAISQFFDTFLVVIIFFYGILPINIMFEIFLTTYIIKVIIAILDTPFCYIGRYLARKNLKN